MPTIEDELNRRQMLYSLLMPVMNLWVTHRSLLIQLIIFNFYSAVHALIQLSSSYIYPSLLWIDFASFDPAEATGQSDRANRFLLQSTKAS
jgi:hypothetical protein